MDLRDAIYSRRSVRSFTSEPVTPEAVQELLGAAMQAPSAGNEQPWQFIVIDDRGLLDAIPQISPYAPMCRVAPLAVLVCGDRREVRHTGYWVQDCSAATENLLLTAHALGLGAVWTGVHPNDERERAFRALLGLPEEIVPMALVVLGVPAESGTPVLRFNPDRVHNNGW